MPSEWLCAELQPMVISHLAQMTSHLFFREVSSHTFRRYMVVYILYIHHPIRHPVLALQVNSYVILQYTLHKITIYFN